MSQALKFLQAGSADKLYVEDAFSVYTYTGNGSTQTITNGIDLSGKGGLVWIKDRDVAYDHFLCDTVRGALYELRSNGTILSNSRAGSVTAFNSNGFSLGNYSTVNSNAEKYVAWSFRKAAKFFDCGSYSGTGSAQNIAHSLGVAPGMILVKAYSGTTANSENWAVYHRSTDETDYLKLNLTDATADLNTPWNDTAPTSTQFTVGSHSSTNSASNTYVWYAFAHDTTTDGIIQCGSFTTDGSGNATVTLGWEPQYVLMKRSVGGTSPWYLFDTMRAFNRTTNAYVQAESSAAETSFANTDTYPTATGFVTGGNVTNASSTFIYLAIRRPNKPPTSGTQVYASSAHIGTEPTRKVITAGFPVDLSIQSYRNLAGVAGYGFIDRLRGGTQYLLSYNTNAEGALTSPDNFLFDSNTTLTSGQGAWNNTSANGVTFNFFRRAPGVMDEVCYTGTGVAKTEAHNLGVVPEMMIVKRRSGSATNWWVYSSALGASNTSYLSFTTGASGWNGSMDLWNATPPTSSVFSIGTAAGLNAISETHVAYLFATVAGISKVGSYTGNGGTAGTNGTSQTINCGFTTGARFVLIKRTDSTGNWYVFDSTRGIVAGNDPYLLLNSTAAEVTTVDAVDADNSGFVVNQTSGTDLNVTSATYIFLSLA